ncbi:hypothetical protein CXG81DRAFT_10461 [Caulochytrium protostelioides]|uniref:C2H2-type domain-containing protein n=1 Tax=Caulochytrium protostelioides TaxID=1555241 RepID=A0A4P9XB89_9FUNG|nr:hypothetical protein CXG81DRAFT_10461 [Caulochytrium protostelioides]|eukprot:RKP02677.1 hypothetical protein CXG81DRAFT_10461 [Caulochytrium protostelioides]
MDVDAGLASDVVRDGEFPPPPPPQAPNALQPLVTAPFRVLLLGEGDFTFALALARLLWDPAFASPSLPGASGWSSTPAAVLDAAAAHPDQIAMVATSFDTREEVLDKYKVSKDTFRHLAQLAHRLHGGRGPRIPRIMISHAVNAWDLKTVFPHQTFHATVWNHPHLGTEDFRLHRFLMAHFFHSVHQVLVPATESTTEVDDNVDSEARASHVIISLVKGQELRWQVNVEARRTGFHQVAAYRFDEALWPGYVVRRNKHGGSFKNNQTMRHMSSEMPSLVHQFSNAREPEASVELSEDVVMQALAVSMAQTTLNGATGPATAAPDGDAASSAAAAAAAARVPIRAVGLPLGAPQLNGDVQAKPKAPRKKPSRRGRPYSQQAPADLTCHDCNKVLGSDRAYLQHRHMVHTLKIQDRLPDAADGSYVCAPCGKPFEHRSALWQHHVNKHTAAVSLTRLPEHSGRSSPLMLLHGAEAVAAQTQAMDQDPEYGWVPCHVCGQAVQVGEQGMLIHLEMLKPALGLAMQCPMCDKTFIENRALLQHAKFCQLRHAALLR